MFNISRFRSTKATSSTFISELEKKVRGNQQFMETIQKWRDIEIKYIGQLMQLQTKMRDRIEEYSLQPDLQFLQVIQTIVKSHKNSIIKINHEIFQSCFRSFREIIDQQKGILTEQKCQNKQFICKKEGMSKLRQKNMELKKNLYEQLIQEIFCHNSVAESQKKQKVIIKASELNQKMQQHDEKVKDAKQQYKKVVKRSKINLKRFDNFQNSFIQQALGVVKKAKNYINLYAIALQNQVLNSQKTRDITIASQSMENITIEPMIQKFEKQQQYLLKQSSKGYLEATIQLIRKKELDEITQYTKDKQIKRKLKAVLETNQVSPQFTDQLTRQVQLVKKMLRTKQMSSMEQFKNIISKGTKSRLNYIFMLQLYRINSQFEMTQHQIQPIIILINELLKISHKKRDAFIIKQTIILLLTYYITIKVDDKQHKVYILHFFKNKKIWKDLQLWESMLIECIYIQKKATLRMLLTASCMNNKSQLVQAQKALVLSQIHYIVKNMILFDFTQKQVKQFVNRFIKLLSLDEIFLKDVYNNIDNYKAQQGQNLQSEQLNLEKHQFSRLIIEEDDGSISS